MRKALALAAWFATLAWLEHRRPLRATTQPRPRRFAINAAMAGITFAVIGGAQSRVFRAATRLVETRRWGLLPRLHLPPAIAHAAGVLLLDYTLWHWHRLNHAVPLLWRSHASHHVDPDLDVSTALRFHTAEMLASAPYRAAQILALGIDRRALRTWETMTVVAILFHHANLRLPIAVDRALSWVVITPRLHGTHHAVSPLRLGTNFGTLFAFWDALHGTRDRTVGAAHVVVGLPDRSNDRVPSLVESLMLPWSDPPRADARGGEPHVRDPEPAD